VKQSTKTKWTGFIFFFVGSILVQQFIDPLLYIGLIFLGISWMFMNAQLDIERSEKSMEELLVLHKKIEASLEQMKNLGESDEKSDDSDYFDNKRSEIDKEK